MHTALVEAYNRESFSEAQYFIFYIISIANNCRACMEFVKDLKVLYLIYGIVYTSLSIPLGTLSART